MNTHKNIAIFGASGAIGTAFVNAFANHKDNQVHAFSRSHKKFDQENVHSHQIDIQNETSIEKAIASACQNTPLDIVIITIGILHQNLNETDETTAFGPEKSLSDLTAEKFQKLFEINTIGPALIAKHTLPLMNKDKTSIFCALSARIGSISDNHLGSWYAYRASKAALNMIIKTASIEMQRRKYKTIVIGLHPGTVDSQLSQPFQRSVSKAKLFTPEYSVSKMLNVIENLTPDETGKIFAWDGQEIPY